MSTCRYFSERYKPFDPDLSEKDRRLADEVSEDYDRRRQAMAEKRARELQQIGNKARSEIRNLLGTENWLALHRLMRDEQITFRTLLQPPEGLNADYDELNARRVAAGQRFLSDHGIDSSDLRAVARRATHEIEYRPTVQTPVLRDISVETYQDVGENLLPRHPSLEDLRRQWAEAERAAQHEFKVFTPPFPGGQTGFDCPTFGEFRAGHQVFLDEAAGLVGHDIMLDDPDASDLDVGECIVDTQVLFNFKAPVAGPVEVVIEAQSGLAIHELGTEDEWGWSESDTRQNNFLMMHVIHPNVTGPTFAHMSDFRFETDESVFIRQEKLERGRIFERTLFSDGPVAQGDVVEIRVGTRSHDLSFTNDVEIHSKSQFHWSIRSVKVRIPPL